MYAGMVLWQYYRHVQPSIRTGIEEATGT